MNATGYLRDFSKKLLKGLVGDTNYRALLILKNAQQLNSSPASLRSGLELYKHWVKPHTIVFDIGANIGNRTRLFSTLGARVIAVEPQSHCSRALRWQFLLQKKISIIEAAVGPDNLPKVLTEFDTDVLSSLNPKWVSLARDTDRYGKPQVHRVVTVPCVTLDDLVAKYGRPSFIKIDVEGYEAGVLKGLSRSAGTISFEITPEFLTETFECLQLLEGLGYRKFHISLGESMHLGGEWMDLDSVKDVINNFASGQQGFADIYALDPEASPGSI